MYLIPKVCSQCSDISGAMGLRPVHRGAQGCGGGGGGIEFPFCSTSCETPKGIQCCKMSIPLGVSQVVSMSREDYLGMAPLLAFQ